MRRRRLRAPVVLALLLCALALSPAGPGAIGNDRFTTAWQVDVTVPNGTFEADVTAGTFLARTNQGVLAYDTADGSNTWAYRLLTARAVNWQPGPEMIAVAYDRPRLKDADQFLVGISVADGKEQWRRNGLSFPPGWYATSVGEARPAAFVAGDRKGLRGVDVETGADLWHFLVPDGCKATTTTARARSALLVLTCGATAHVLLLDALTGATRWSVSFPAAPPPFVHFAGDAVAVRQDHAITVLGSRGETVSRQTGCWPDCTVVGRGGELYALYRSGNANTLAEVGGPAWSKPAYTGLLNAGPYLVGSRTREPGSLRMIDVIAPDTGRSRSYTLSVPGQIVGAAGGRLYTWTRLHGVGQTTRVRFTAFRRVRAPAGPSPLSGVDPHRWPDACALPPGPAFTATSAQSTLGDLSMPRPVACTYTGADGITLSARVVWVAPSVEEADELLRTLAEADALVGVAGVGDRAAKTSGLVVFRVGTAVVRVTSDHAAVRGRLIELAGSMAARLRVPAAAQAVPGVPAEGSGPITLVRLPGTQVTVERDVLPAYVVKQNAYVGGERVGGKVDVLSPDLAHTATGTEQWPTTGHRDHVTITDVATGDTHVVPTVAAPRGTWRLVWSPDGRRLLMTASKDNDSLDGFVIVDMATMRARFTRVGHPDRYTGRFVWGDTRGTTVAVQNRPEDDEQPALDVTLFTLDGKISRKLRHVGQLFGGVNWLSPSGNRFMTHCPSRTDQTCVWESAGGALLTRIGIAPKDVISWWDEDRLLGWRDQNAYQRAAVPIDFHNETGPQVAAAPTGYSVENLQLFFSRP
ncbi:PQQ-binding-like beta-propeller repeat protein [Nonomuraea sp. NPDC047529]|uniref:outer membrane protein assembly factor BamB family protein n=1 Tax=Nonomuraea sp. NPDC047529 TaxID=3155623 RepID=UPI0033C8F5A9